MGLSVAVQCIALCHGKRNCIVSDFMKEVETLVKETRWNPSDKTLLLLEVFLHPHPSLLSMFLPSHEYQIRLISPPPGSPPEVFFVVPLCGCSVHRIPRLSQHGEQGGTCSINILTGWLVISGLDGGGRAIDFRVAFYFQLLSSSSVSEMLSQTAREGRGAPN